jgi:LuxR family maltose regulon positive regulatory protein
VLTPAERRVLDYLPTHLSLQEIGDELHVSRNTAKTHTVAIYRKLGVSSRREAVEVARHQGLLDAAEVAVTQHGRIVP